MKKTRLLEKMQYSINFNRYLSSSFYAFMNFLQKVPLSAPLWVTDGGGVCRLRDEDVWATLIDPRGTVNLQHQHYETVTVKSLEKPKN